MNRFLAACLLVIAHLPGIDTVGAEEGEPDILGVMSDLQRYAHKLDLAIGHGNWPLASFYEHELEESLAAARAIETYHGKPIAPLVATMQMPAFEALAESLESGRPSEPAVQEAFDRFVEACNTCHAATGYEIIRIERSTVNPFMQSFKPENP